MLVFEDAFVPVGTCSQDRFCVRAEHVARTYYLDGTGPGQPVS